MTFYERAVVSELLRRYPIDRSIDDILLLLSAAELAMCAGVLSELPAEVSSLAVKAADGDLRQRQFELGLWIPDLLRDRVGGRYSQVVHPALGEVWFDEFLWIDGLIRRNDAFRTYVAMADPVIEPDRRLAQDVTTEFHRIVENPDMLGSVLGGERSEHGSGGEAVEGFVQFVDFCVELDEALKDSAEITALQERLVGFYAPFFERSGQFVVRHAKATVSGLHLAWQEHESVTSDADEIIRNGEFILTVLGNLEDGIYRRNVAGGLAV